MLPPTGKTIQDDPTSLAPDAPMRPEQARRLQDTWAPKLMQSYDESLTEGPRRGSGSRSWSQPQAGAKRTSHEHENPPLGDGGPRQPAANPPRRR